jgi:hypothetical protein
MTVGVNEEEICEEFKAKNTVGIVDQRSRWWN